MNNSKSFMNNRQAIGCSSLITFAVLVLAWISGFASRLFAVIRFESIIHEFDPWFNYRATAYMVEKGFYNFLNWFDDRAWYPLGRIVGGTVYPGLMITSGGIHWILHALNIPIHIRDICVFLAPIFSGLTAISTYFLTKELWSPGAGLFAASFIAIVPGYISRSVAGSYDNEGIAIFALQFTYYLWVKSVKSGSVFWAAMAALSYFYMVSAWGGYVFIINLIPLHVFVLLLMNRYSHRLFTSYTTFYILGLLFSMQIPFVGFQPIRTSEHMAASGVFALLLVVGFLKHLQTVLSKQEFKKLFLVGGAIAAAVVFGAVVILTMAGIVAPWSGRFYSLWDTGYAKIHIPIIASVSEHQPTTWVSFFFDLHILVCTFPAGLWYTIKRINDERVFVILYALSAVYFAGVMVRLMLTLTPVVCILSGIAFSGLLDVFLREDNTPERDEVEEQPTEKKLQYDKEIGVVFVDDDGNAWTYPEFIFEHEEVFTSKGDARNDYFLEFIDQDIEFLGQANEQDCEKKGNIEKEEEEDDEITTDMGASKGVGNVKQSAEDVNGQEMVKIKEYEGLGGENNLKDNETTTNSQKEVEVGEEELKEGEEYEIKFDKRGLKGEEAATENVLQLEEKGKLEDDAYGDEKKFGRADEVNDDHGILPKQENEKVAKEELDDEEKPKEEEELSLTEEMEGVEEKLNVEEREAEYEKSNEQNEVKKDDEISCEKAIEISEERVVARNEIMKEDRKTAKIVKYELIQEEGDIWDVLLNDLDDFYEWAGKLKRPRHEPANHDNNGGIGSNIKSSVIVAVLMLLMMFVVHCTWVTSNAYSSPSIVLAFYSGQDGTRNILDDFREAYYWLSQNTDDDARIMSWWDYGYQIAGMGNRTTLVDNNTWNNSHIALVGKAMSSTEEKAYDIMTSLDVDYVLVIFGGVIGYSGDDINKFLWMVRIAEGEHPKDIRESDFFTERGEFRIDAEGSPTLLNCLMYKLSYYRFGDLKLDYRGPAGYDRTRNAVIGNKNIDLTYLEEAYTSEHWLVRIYRVKKPHEFNRPAIKPNDRVVNSSNYVSKKTSKRRKGIIKKPMVVKGKRPVK